MNIHNGAAPFVGISLNTPSPIIFAGNNTDGVIRSTDNGMSWSLPSSDLLNLDVEALVAIDANSSTPILLAGTNDHGLYRSTNSGTNWTRSDSGMPKNNVIFADFAIAGSEASPLIFVSTAYGNGAGVFLSTDKGVSWKAVNTGLTTLSIGPLMVVSSNPAVPLLFAVGTASGVFRSTDNGTNWTSESTGLPSGSLFSIAALDTNASSPVIFVGTWGAGVFRSMDEGVNWQSVNNGLTDLSIYSLATSGTDLFAGTDSGIFLSTDSGTKWRNVSDGLSPNNSYSYIGIIGSMMFAESDSVIDMFGDASSFAWRRPLSEMIGSNADVITMPSVTQSMSAYPNPATAIEHCMTSFRDQNTKVDIYDLLGRKTLSFNTENPGEFSFDVSMLQDGTYEIICRQGNDIVQGRFIKSGKN